MEEVTSGVYRLGSTHHNFYVVVAGGKATVVDAGCSREWPKLEEALSSIGLDPGDVDGIVITHGHVDHAGGARRAAAAGIQSHIHHSDRARALGSYRGKAAAGPGDLPLFRVDTVRFLVAMIRSGAATHPPLEHVEAFYDGDVLDLPGRPRVVHTPGHTEGHCCFHFPDLGLLFTGDSLVTRDVIGSNALDPQVMEPIFHNDPGMARISLERIEFLDARWVLPGHGRPFHGSPADAVMAARLR